MEQKLLNTLVAHYTARLHHAEANLLCYFKNPVGIGEHPDIVGEMVKLVDDVASAKDGLEVLNGMVQPAAESTSTEEK